MVAVDVMSGMIFYSDAANCDIFLPVMINKLTSVCPVTDNEFCHNIK